MALAERSAEGLAFFSSQGPSDAHREMSWISISMQWTTVPGIQAGHRRWCLLAELEAQRTLGNHEMESADAFLL